MIPYLTEMPDEEILNDQFDEDIEETTSFIFLLDIYTTYRISPRISPALIWFCKTFLKKIGSKIIIFSRNKEIH